VSFPETLQGFPLAMLTALAMLHFNNNLPLPLSFLLHWNAHPQRLTMTRRISSSFCIVSFPSLI
jgi:hypothetical protein